MDEFEDSTNHKITYNAFKEVKFLVKYGYIHEDPMIKEEEEEHEQLEDIKIEKLLKICKNIAEDMEKVKNIVIRDDDTYRNE